MLIGLLFITVEAKTPGPLVGPKGLVLSGASFTRNAWSDLDNYIPLIEGKTMLGMLIPSQYSVTLYESLLVYMRSLQAKTYLLFLYLVVLVWSGVSGLQA